MKKNSPQWLSFLFLLVAWGIGHGRLDAQRPSVYFVKPSEKDTVFFDETTRTINMYIRGKDAKKEMYLDFYDKNLRVSETFGGETTEMELIFQGKYSNKEMFPGWDFVYQIKANTRKKYNHDEKRTYTVNWVRPGSEETIARATVSKDWSPLGGIYTGPAMSFANLASIGVFALLTLLVFLSELVPSFRKLRFTQNYVFPYAKVKAPDETRLHPVTGKRLDLEEKVVKMCDREICCVPYSLWKRKGYQCPNYPEKCEGNARLGFRQFFRQLGLFKRLNWLWFGAVGGLLAWGLHYGLKALGISSVFTKEQWGIIFMGTALGLALTFMLAWVEEKGEGREVAWGRILFRSAIGVFIITLLFYLSAITEAYETTLGAATTWFIFCLILGVALSFDSTITLKRGLISGAVAGLVSTLVYAAIRALVADPEPNLVRMVTFTLAGGVLGLGMVQVLKALNKAALQVLTPDYRSGLTFSLDRWLQAGEPILIGRDMKQAKVRVKWDDEYALPHHAEMQMHQGKVYIKPLGDAELFINDRPLTDGNSQVLRGGERIQLGRHSRTTFKYVQKNK